MSLWRRCRRTQAICSIALLGLAVAASAAEPSAPPGPKEAVLWGGLRRTLEQAAGALDGVAGIAVKDLRTGATIRINADESFPQASSIKLAVLYELHRRSDAGEIDLGEMAPLPAPAERAGSAGVLRMLSREARLTWRDLAVLMMALSDNAATNVLIDRLGMDRVNRTLDGLGLRGTRLRRRMMDLPAALRGDENVSTPSEMLALIEAIHAGRGLRDETARAVRDLAAVDKNSDFRLPLPESVRVLDKPGDLEGVRCVTALVELPRRPYAVTIMTTYLRRDVDGEALIRTVSAAVYDTFDRLDRAADTGRIVSER